MAGPLPHSKAINQQIQGFMGDVIKSVAVASSCLGQDHNFKSIYKSCYFADAFLSQINDAKVLPCINQMRAALRRSTNLICLGQTGSTYLELRRFIEMTFWCLYFVDHQIEWDFLKLNMGKGYVHEDDEPISYSAHRELSYYIRYAKELFEKEVSGLGSVCLNVLSTDVSQLNFQIHPTSLIDSDFENSCYHKMTSSEFASFSALIKRVLSNASIVIALKFLKSFQNLPAMNRAMFDALVGKEREIILRSPDIGIRIE